MRCGSVPMSVQDARRSISDMPPVKSAIQERYKFLSFLCVTIASLRAFFHGGNTGSNPVGDAKQNLSLTEIASIWRGHRWAQKYSATCAAERAEHCVCASVRANFVGTNGHKPWPMDAISSSPPRRSRAEQPSSEPFASCRSLLVCTCPTSLWPRHGEAAPASP